MSTRTTVSDVIGDYLKTFRDRHGLSRDAVAQQARKLGAVMTASTVQSIEQGEHAASITTVVILTGALGQLSGRPLRLADLFENSEALAVPGRSAQLDAEYLRQALSGQPVVLPEVGDEETPEPDSRYHVGSLCEARAARRLGVSPEQLRTAACQLWGRSLEEEILDRVSPTATPQHRGHITRLLVEQLAQRLVAVAE